MVLCSTDLLLIPLSSLYNESIVFISCLTSFAQDPPPFTYSTAHSLSPPFLALPLCLTILLDLSPSQSKLHFVSLFKPTQPGQALIMPSVCYRGHFEEEEDGVKLKCRGGGKGGGKSTYTQTHNSQSTLGDRRGPRNLSSLEHLILGSGPRTTISVHNWHRPPETL